MVDVLDTSRAAKNCSFIGTSLSHSEAQYRASSCRYKYRSMVARFVSKLQPSGWTDWNSTWNCMHFYLVKGYRPTVLDGVASFPKGALYGSLYHYDFCPREHSRNYHKTKSIVEAVLHVISRSRRTATIYFTLAYFTFGTNRKHVGLYMTSY